MLQKNQKIVIDYYSSLGFRMFYLIHLNGYKILHSKDASQSNQPLGLY